MKNSIDLKCIIVGNCNVGKSALLHTFIHGSSCKILTPTFCVAFEQREMKLNKYKVNLKIWDTAGQEQFKSITRSYFNNAAVGFIVYDITDLETFHSVQKWFDECQYYGKRGITMVLVGNKTDLEHKRKVPTYEASSLADQLDISFIETSAFSGQNVEEAFQAAVQSALEVVPQVPEIHSLPLRLNPNIPKQKTKKCC